MKFDEFKSSRQLLTNPNNPNALYDGCAFSSEGQDLDVLNAMPKQFVYSLLGDLEVVEGFVDGAFAYFVAKNIAPTEKITDTAPIAEADIAIDSEYTEEFAEETGESARDPSAEEVAESDSARPKGLLGIFR